MQVYEEENADNEDIEKAQKRSEKFNLGPINQPTENAGSCNLKQPAETSSKESKSDAARSNGRKKKQSQKQKSLSDVQDAKQVKLHRNSSVKLPKVRHHPDQLRPLSVSGNGHKADIGDTTADSSSKPKTSKVSDVEQVEPCLEEAAVPLEEAMLPVEPAATDETDDKELIAEKLQTLHPRVICGDVIEVRPGWKSDCCQECTKSGSCSIDEESNRLVCESCGARYKDKSGLVQRQFANVTLKTEDQEIVKMCYHRELMKFCKDNGDSISKYRANERLAAYLKEQKSLKLELDDKNYVSNISKY